MKVSVFCGSAAVVAIILTTSHGGGGGVAASLTATPLTGSGSQQQWAQNFLTAIGKPQTACNVRAITAWEAAEGGGPGGDGATYNNLNTTQPEPGDWSINSVGVKAYPSYQEGLNANVTAITNGLYGGILAALQAGNNAQNVADQVADSPWGTGAFAATC